MSSELRYTRGPWNVEQTCANELSIGPGDLQVCTILADDDRASGDTLTDEDRANASLIAAAPELFETLQDAFIALPMAKHNRELLGRIKAVMAKALGAETPVRHETDESTNSK